MQKQNWLKSLFDSSATSRRQQKRRRHTRSIISLHHGVERQLTAEQLEDRALLAGDFGFAAALGGSGFDNGLAVATDAAGNVYTTGLFSGTVDFDPGGGTFDLSSAGNDDVFVSKLDSAGNFVWARSMGGSGSENGRGIAVDATGNVYTTGFFSGTGDFDPGPGTFNLSSAGSLDIFVSKLDSAGDFVWARRMGGSGNTNDQGYGIAADAAGNVYTTGLFSGSGDFDPGSGTFNLSSAGSLDIFVSKLDSSGNFVWARSMAGSDRDQGRGIAVDAAGNVFTTGIFSGTVDFDPGGGTFSLNGAGDEDIFVSKLDSSGNFVWASGIGGSDNDRGREIGLDAAGNVYTTGHFSQTVDFDPGAGTFNLSSAGSEDIFVSKFDSSGNFVWASGIGGSGNDKGYRLDVDAIGNVYTTGHFKGTADSDPGAGAFNLSSAGSEDIFVSKLDNAGSFVWARSMGGSGFDQGRGIAVDDAGNVLTTGFFSGIGDFDPGPGTFNLNSAGSQDIFVSQLTQNLPPSIDDQSFDVDENETSVGAVVASDPDLPGDALTFVITGAGPDDAKFSITAGGVLSFDAAADFESPTDVGGAPGDNTYLVEVQATDAAGESETANIEVNVLNLASITGTAFVDVNGDGLMQATEPGIDGVIVELLDEIGNPVLDDGDPVTATTSDGGFYLFEDLDSGAYQLHQIQPTGVDDGAELLGSLGGTIPANDVMQLTLAQVDAFDYLFAELGQEVASGDTATIGFWQNKHGQALIAEGGDDLASWLTNNFGNVFGNSLLGGTGEDVADFYRDQLFKQKAKKSAGPAKVDAQFMAVALATYFTSSNLTGNVAAAYGFNVTDTGIGTKTANVGINGAAFGMADGTDLAIMQLLLATNSLTDVPDNVADFSYVYDVNGDGVIDSGEAALRSMANIIYTDINEGGDI